MCTQVNIFDHQEMMTMEDTKISLNSTEKMFFSFIIIISVFTEDPHLIENQTMQGVREWFTCA